jgi:hypothetical protein
MTEANIAFNPSEDDILVNDISDEALEATACVGPHQAKAFTVSLCTVMADCAS